MALAKSFVYNALSKLVNLSDISLLQEVRNEPRENTQMELAKYTKKSLADNILSVYNENVSLWIILWL
jgi:hypothetical protein